MISLDEIYSKSPYDDYEELRNDLQKLNPKPENNNVRLDPLTTSPLTAIKRKINDTTLIKNVDNLETYGIVLKVEDSPLPGGFKKIYIDIPTPDNLKPVEHPDYFSTFNENFDINEYKHIIFSSNSSMIEEYDPPLRGGIAKIILDPNFPESARFNKYLGMVKRKTVFTFSDNVGAISTSDANVSYGNASSGEPADPNKKLLTTEDVQSAKTLYENLKMGQKSVNKKVEIYKQDAITKLLMLKNLEFRRDAANLFNLSWENGIYITINNTIRDDFQQALMYVGGRYCDSKYYEVISLPYVSSHAVGCALDINGLSVDTLTPISTKIFPFKLVETKINKGYSLGLRWIGESDPVHWEWDKDKLLALRDAAWEEKGMSLKTLPEETVKIIKRAIKQQFSLGASLYITPRNIPSAQIPFLLNNSWWPSFYQELMGNKLYASR